jgi:type IV pilus biogenesis protein CpaD/CtpE
MFKKTILAVAIVAALTGCQSNQLSSEAQRVALAPNPPSANCRFIQAISTDKQASFLSHGFSTNSLAEEAAMNDLKNQAAGLGGNYVQMTATRSGMSNDEQQIQVSYTGKVYQCPGSLY